MKSMYLKKNMQKYFKFSLKKDAQITLGFLVICQKKKLFLFFEALFGKKTIFFL